MNEHPYLIGMKFDVIIFNFPHAGHYSGFCDTDCVLIRKNKRLVGSFFKSAREMVSEGGEVHVTHKDRHPYNEWNLVELAEKSGLVLKEKVAFSKEDYPGHHNERGGGIKSNQQFPIRHAFTFKFCLVSSSTQSLADNFDQKNATVGDNLSSVSTNYTIFAQSNIQF